MRFYAIQDSVSEPVKLQDLNTEKINVGYIDYDELKDCSEVFGFSETTVKECITENGNFRSSIDVYDDYSFCIINIIDPADLYASRDRIAIYIKENLFWLVKIIDHDDSTEDVFNYALERIGRFKQENVTLEKAIYAFISRLLDGDNKVLENIGGRITELEEIMLAGGTDKNFNYRLFQMKKDLMVFCNYYEQLIDIGEELQENENEIFTEEDLMYFRMFSEKAKRLSDNAQLNMDNLIHLREAYDAMLEYNQNTIMKLFTTVTTIFSPLTLIVGWYGMNFRYMPELNSKFGYPAVIGVSVIIAIICIIIFKKKKYF